MDVFTGLGAWMCRNDWHHYGLYLEIGSITSPRTIERCTRCGKETNA